MTTADPNRIPISDAIRSLGNAIFGADWIDALTPRECWLVGYYVDGSIERQSGSIGVGHISYIEVGRPSLAIHPHDPALLGEVERARDRQDCKEFQNERVLDWLEDNGFDSDAPSIERAAFEHAIAKLRPPILAEGATPRANKKHPEKLTAKAARKITSEYIAAMKAANRNPTQLGLVEYAQKQDIKGGRDHLREAFRNQQGDNFRGPGRPKKNSPT